MKYTKDDLAKMPSNEISGNLALLLGWQVKVWRDENNSATVLIYPTNEIGYFHEFNILDWSHIMPLAVEHDIIHDYTINKNAKKIFYAYHKRLDISSDWSQSLQRSIACCLILVLQERE